LLQHRPSVASKLSQLSLSDLELDCHLRHFLESGDYLRFYTVLMVASDISPKSVLQRVPF